MLDSYVESIAHRRTPTTIKTIKYRWNCWTRFGCEFTQEGIERFRAEALAYGLSAWTIETTIAVAVRVHRFHGVTASSGEALQKPRPDPIAPPLTAVSAAYEHVGAARWPMRLTATQRSNWWRAYLAVSCWTAFRISDIRALKWEHDQGAALHLRAIKNRRYGGPAYQPPVTPMLRRHLDAIRPLYDDSIFAFTQCHKPFRAALQSICDAAGVDIFTPQQLRRLSVQQWSIANPRAGEIVHGKGLGVLRHYIEQSQLLASVAPTVAMPAAFYSDAERREIADSETEMMRRFRMAPSETRRLLLDLARKIS